MEPNQMEEPKETVNKFILNKEPKKRISIKVCLVFATVFVHLFKRFNLGKKIRLVEHFCTLDIFSTSERSDRVG